MGDRVVRSSETKEIFKSVECLEFCRALKMRFQRKVSLRFSRLLVGYGGCVLSADEFRFGLLRLNFRYYVGRQKQVDKENLSVLQCSPSE